MLVGCGIGLKTEAWIMRPRHFLLSFSLSLSICHPESWYRVKEWELRIKARRYSICETVLGRFGWDMGAESTFPTHACRERKIGTYLRQPGKVRVRSRCQRGSGENVVLAPLFIDGGIIAVLLLACVLHSCSWKMCVRFKYGIVTTLCSITAPSSSPELGTNISQAFRSWWHRGL
jgi:hypothetical protein